MSSYGLFFIQLNGMKRIKATGRRWLKKTLKLAKEQNLLLNTKTYFHKWARAVHVYTKNGLE